MKVTEHSLKLLHKEYKNINDFYTDDELREILSKIRRPANVRIADAFLDYIWEEDNIRQCTVCGELMNDGYYLDGDYACCDKCRNEYYIENRGCKTEEEAEKVYLEDYDDGDGDFYYTEWY
jgi:hypothetical protein